MTTTTIEAIKGLRTVPSIPRRGEHYLSVNLALADAGVVWEVAREHGVTPELVQMKGFKDGIEIHALLVFEQLDGNPITNLLADTLSDALADRIDNDAIRHCYGGRMRAL